MKRIRPSTRQQVDTEQQNPTRVRRGRATLLAVLDVLLVWGGSPHS